MATHLQDSVILITSSDSDNRRFGTGFVFFKEEGAFYVLTCAHVVADVGGIEQVCIEERSASVIVLGEINTTDLAILRIDGHTNRPIISLDASANIGDDFSTAGFQLSGKRLLVRKLNGKLGEFVGLTYWGQTERTKAWDIQILDDYQLQPGYSGSPVVSSRGRVIGVVSDRQGTGHRGLAISVEALNQIWSEKPHNLQIHGLPSDSATEDRSFFDIASQSEPIISVDVGQNLPVAYISRPIFINYTITNNSSLSLRLATWQIDKYSDFDLKIISDLNSGAIIDPNNSWVLKISLTSNRYGRFSLPILSCSFFQPKNDEEPQYFASPPKSLFVDIGWENELIGRENAITTLRTLHEKASSGQGQIILIHGNAGAGKSYLVNKFLSSHASNSLCLAGQCESFHKDLSFLPFKQALERTLSLPKFASTKDRSKQAHIKLVEAFPQLEQSIPYLTYFLLSDHEHNLEVDSKTGRERFFFAFLQLVKNLSVARPIVFYLQDMQWIDASSLDLLQFLIDNINDLPIFIVGEYRSEEVEAKYGSEQKAHPLSSFIRRNITRSNFVQIEIKSMSQNNLIAWISKLFPQNELPRKFLNLVFNETEGNPLFAREVLKSLIEQEILSQNEENKWIVSDDIESLGLPSTIEQVIANRVELLGSDERRELENASVIGRDFAYQVLQAVSDQDDYVLMDYLDNYLDIRLITELEDRDDYFRFMHGKIREYVYEATRKFRRRRIHLRLATIMENLYSGALASVSPIIAYHYKEGGDTKKAIEYYLLAGQENLNLYSNQEAKINFTEALSLTRSNSNFTGNDLEYLKILNGLSLAIRHLNEFSDAIELYKQVLDTAKILQHYDILVKAASELATTSSILDNHDEAQLYCSLAIDYSKHLDDPVLTLRLANDLVDITRREHRAASIRNDTQKIRESLGELANHTQVAFELSRNVRNPTQLVRTYKNVGLTDLLNYKYDDAIKMLEKAISIAEAENDKPSKYVYVHLGDVYSITNQRQKALDAYNKYCNWAIEIGAKHAEQKAYQILALQHIFKKEYTEAMSYIEKGLSLAEVVGASNNHALLYICIGYVHEEKDGFDQALDAYQHALEILGVVNEKDSTSIVMHKIAQALVHNKEHELAKHYYRRCLEIDPQFPEKEEILFFLNSTN